MTASAVPTSVLAASIGSSSTDANIGEDTAQNAKTSYAEIFKNNNETQVYLTVDDKDRVVSLPTTVILSGTPDAQGKYIGKYSVGVSGDMSGKKIVKVEPESTASLTQKGKNNVTASIAQDQVNFDTDDFKNKTVTNGSISADSLTAGSWNSNFNFNVSTEVNGVPAGYTSLYKYDLSATNNDNVAAYYCVPNKNTEEVIVSEQNESSKAKMKKATKIASSKTSANNNVIEYNGVRYVLSDEDTLIITGQGKMKENIQADLYSYKELQANVSEHFGIKSVYTDQERREEVANGNNLLFYWPINSLYPALIKDGLLTVEDDMGCVDYINSIKDNYVVNMPTTVIIQNGITNISKNAFYNCESLTNVTMSNSVISIDDYAFYNCPNLRNITLSNKLVRIGDYTFAGCAFSNVKIPNQVTNIGNYAFEACENLNSITIPNSVKNIGRFAFLLCKNLSTIKIPDSVTSIGSAAFESCSNLTSVTLSNNLTCIDDCVFYNCESLTKVTIPNSVKKIGYMTFAGCKSLTNINIPDNVTSIARYAFHDCTNLKNIAIPNSIVSINEFVFEGCANLANVYIPDSIKSIDRNAFSGLKKGSKIYCQSQTVANLLKDGTNYDSSKTTVVVDTSKF